MSLVLPDIPKSSTLSRLATKYGPRDHGIFKGTGKSSLTPVSPWDAETAKSPRSWKIRARIERWQMSRLGGWTARELNRMEVLAAYETALPNNLTNEIHPLFQRENWVRNETQPLHRPMIPLGRGREGYWEAQNPVVWAALEPCLRLASQFIDNFHLWSWWDTWLYGELTNIQDEPYRGTGKWLRSVWHRDPEIAAAGENDLKQAFIKLSDELRIGLADGFTAPYDGLPIDMEDNNGCWAGITFYDYELDRESVFLDYRLLETLVMDDLTTAEIAVAQFNIARVMVHEIAHAVWSLDDRRARQTHGEPYFENEGVAEGGDSMTNFIVDGLCIPFNVRAPEAGMFARSWPIIRSFAGLENPPLEGLPTEWELYPIPMEYFERVSQMDFWDYYVPRFGPEALHFSPLTYGCTIRYRPPADQKLPEHNAWRNRPQVPVEGWMSPRTLKYVELENKRLATADRIIKGLEEVRSRETAVKMAVLQRLSGSAPDVESLEELSQPGRPLYLPPEPAEGPYSGHQLVPEDVNSIPEPARFREIRDFLFQYRETLAMDSLISSIPENTLLAYINRVGVITLTAEELREFLIYCACSLESFFGSLQIIYGLYISVKVIDKGWPPRPPAPQIEAPVLPPEHLNYLKAFMVEEQFHKTRTKYNSRFLDYDSEMIRKLYNRNRGLNDYRPELNKQEWDLIMDYCDHANILWNHGPPGIIRLKAYPAGHFPNDPLGAEIRAEIRADANLPATPHAPADNDTEASTDEGEFPDSAIYSNDESTLADVPGQPDDDDAESPTGYLSDDSYVSPAADDDRSVLDMWAYIQNYVNAAESHRNDGRSVHLQSDGDGDSEDADVPDAPGSEDDRDLGDDLDDLDYQPDPGEVDDLDDDPMEV